jgi:hypothetical protein
MANCTEENLGKLERLMDTYHSTPQPKTQRKAA